MGKFYVNMWYIVTLKYFQNKNQDLQQITKILLSRVISFFTWYQVFKTDHGS